jgi:plasmid stability protein
MDGCATQNPCYTGLVVANLTISIDDDLLRRARIRALEQGTSVNALLREYLLSFAGRDETQDHALSELLELSRGSESRRGGEQWSRDDLHDR